jgi:CRP-like cAMP-binding protein
VKQNTFAADRKLIQALEHRSQPISCSKGCILFRQGDAASGLYILQSGEATLMMETASGRAVMCLQAGAGSLLGLPGIIGNEPYSMTAMARKGSEVRYVPRDDFEDVIRTEPSLNTKVLEILAAEVRSARHALSET